MIKKYYDSDCDIKMLDGKTIAIMGFGSQGHAHAMNLKDSGCNVVVGLRPGSRHEKKAKEYGLKVMPVAEAAKKADIVMMLVPDEICADIYDAEVAPYMTEGKVLMFAHGLNIHFKLIKPAKDIDVIMVAPKGPGHTVRSQYVEGKGVPSLSRRTRPARLRTMRSPMLPASARAERASSRPRSERRPRPTCSASNACFAAASPS